MKQLLFAMLFGLIVAVLCVALPAHARDLCGVYSLPRIDVKVYANDAEVNSAYSLAKMQEKQVDTVNPYAFGTISRTHGVMEGLISIKPEISLETRTYPDRQVGCVAYDEIIVNITIDPIIHIAREVHEDSCQRRAVMGHEMKHVRADRRVVNTFARRLESALRRGLRERGYSAGPIAADLMDGVVQRMQDTVKQIVDIEYKRLDLERTEAHARIDTRQEYERISRMCR